MDPREVAKRLGVRRSRRRAGAEIDGLVRDFAKLRISPQLDTRMVVDGTRYEAWFQARSTDFSISTVGPVSALESENQLIKWMDRVRRSALDEVE